MIICFLIFFLTVKPEITIRNRRLGQKKDKETMLECLVTASPQGDNYWKMGKREIVSNEYGYRIEVYPEDDYTVAIALRVLSVQDRDFGIYTCEAKNVLGVASDSMELYGLYYISFVKYNEMVVSVFRNLIISLWSSKEMVGWILTIL